MLAENSDERTSQAFSLEHGLYALLKTCLYHSHIQKLCEGQGPETWRAVSFQQNLAPIRTPVYGWTSYL